MSEPDERAIANVAREAYGKLLAQLAKRSHDIALAEDALGGAFLAALEQWPEHGVPENPEAWLFKVASRGLHGEWRKRAVRERKAEALRHLSSIKEEEREMEAKEDQSAFGDERLSLLFACAHPAIDARIRAPLMLQSVFGMSAEAIATLVVAPSKTLGQRLWRAKEKIRAAKIPFVVPEGEALGERVESVLEAIYGLYVGARGERSSQADEACWLAGLVARLLPEEPEALGLHALLLYAFARREASRVDERFVPLDEQDSARWEERTLRLADQQLMRASALRHIGPYQLEAAIQSATMHGLETGEMDHVALLALHDALIAIAPTLGAQVSRAATLARAVDTAAGLRALDELAERAHRYQPYWAVRAALLRGTQPQRAQAAYDIAIELTEDDGVRSFLEDERAGCVSEA